MPFKKLQYSKKDMKDSEQWIVILDDTKDAINKLSEEVDSRNKLLKSNPNASDLPKINSEIRRQFKAIERVLIDLKETLSMFDKELSQREISRRKDDVQTTIKKEQAVKQMFDSPNATAANRNELLNDDDIPTKSNKRVSYDEEPESIRDLENGQVLMYQQKVMQDQDKSLDMLSQALERTKHIGLSIDEELDEHTRLLEDIHENVDVTDSKIKVQTKKIVTLAKRNSFMCWGICIAIVLFIIAVGLLIVLLSTTKL